MEFLYHMFLSFAVLVGTVSFPTSTTYAFPTTQPTSSGTTSSYYVSDGNGSGIEDAPLITIDQNSLPKNSNPSKDNKVVALTFDDGPRASSTQKVLAILRREHVQATFFLVGSSVERYPDIAREIVADGHVVGLHTYDHPSNLPWMNAAHRDWELSANQAIIASTTGVHTSLFRPPYGIMTPKTKTILEAQGYTVLMWNVDPRDWDYRRSTSDKILKNIMTHLNARMIILFHDGRDSHGIHNNLEESLPTIINELRSRGYSFVTIDKI